MSQSYIFPPHERAALAVAGTDACYPVRRVYCVGRNYAGHAREMGSDPTREPPFFFCKPGDAAAVVPVAPGQQVALPYPPQTADYHFECELVVAIGAGGSDIAVEDAGRHIFGYAVGLDMTRRDLQARMKDAGRPWEIGKAFDYSAPVGQLRRAGEVPHIEDAAITLALDGTLRQSGRTSHMIWSVAETVARLSTLFRLEAGDLIFTGTPEGVGAVRRGQSLHGAIEGLADLSVRFD